MQSSKVMALSQCLDKKEVLVFEMTIHKKRNYFFSLRCENLNSGTATRFETNR